ncbi:hypothetical protein SEA_DELORIS_76 [Mycobacterium phage Deloris]|nr:hypothetical protein SEA_BENGIVUITTON_76 [Mycobacterium phage BengiVuitton]UXE04069.1 hypothetical protein SEA_DELORIS_76 [Mycobacterium phage Deloris]
MYVDDIDDLEELEFLRDEAADRLEANPANEQASWDLEDIEGRIDDLSAEVGGSRG